MTLTENQKALGWRDGTVAEFLGLTPTESARIEIKIALVGALRARRQELGLSQRACATRLGIKQPQLARMELGVERAVTLDTLMDALMELGLSRQQVGLLVAGQVTVEEKISVPSQPKVMPLALRPKIQRRVAKTRSKVAR